MSLTNRLITILGPASILVCMLLRATDVLFRSVTRDVISPLEMITLEHLIAALVLIPTFPGIAPLRRLSIGDWLVLLFIAGGVSVGGILCFTTAFGLINPAVVILLQKLQPVITITLSIVFLRERVAPVFYPLAGTAILAAYVLVFGFQLPDAILHENAVLGAILALAATALWGSGTALGKSLLTKLEPGALTRYRYYFGLVFALILTSKAGLLTSPAIINHPKLLLNITYMALVPGMAALFFFYWGLRSTSASIASILELSFPVASVAIAWVFLGQRLAPTQIGASVVLLGCILAITRINRSNA